MKKLSQFLFFLHCINITLTVLGVLYTKEKLDFESTESIDVNLIVYDTGHPQLSTVATIFIKVININDNSPTFKQVGWIEL